MLTSPRWGEQGLSSILLNGLSEPAPLVVHAGVPQRLRIINLTIVNQNAVVSLESGKQTVLWRPIAIDGADLPARRTQMQHALQTLTIGQTRDFEFVPTRASSVSFVVRARANGPVTGSMQIRVI